MHLVLSIGSNISATQVHKAIEWLSGRLTDMAVSDVYRTPAVKVGSRTYSNAVACGNIVGSCDEFDAELKQYEFSCGRDEEARGRGDVPIDIDIVLADGRVLRDWDYRQSFFRTGYNQIV